MKRAGDEEGGGGRRQATDGVSELGARLAVPGLGQPKAARCPPCGVNPLAKLARRTQQGSERVDSIGWVFWGGGEREKSEKGKPCNQRLEEVTQSGACLKRSTRPAVVVPMVR